MPTANPTKMNRQGGFTLVELLVAILITGIISVSIYSMYTTFFRQSAIQDQSVEAQQNARVALNLMERELMNAGYAADTNHIITEATANSIKFIYSDPNTTGTRLEVRYGLQTTGGVQYLVRKADNLTTATIGNTEDVAQYVETLAFTYFDINGNPISPPMTEAQRDSIKFLTVNIVTRTKDNIPGTTAPGTFMLETHIRLRNIGVGQASNDPTPPSAPTGVQVRDAGLCNRLKVKWTKNPEGDVAGYRIDFGVNPGVYDGRVVIPLTVMSAPTYNCTEVGSSIECTITPATALAYTPSDGSSTTTYYVAVRAYDRSINWSGYSSEVSGNPSPSNSVFDSGVDDSTINPVKPVAVTGLTAVDGPADGQVALSWTAYDTTANPDVTGFRLYRSESPFTSYPIDPDIAGGIITVAGEPGHVANTLTPSATSYTDSGSLVGCKTYYYAIAPVNCDDTLISDSGGDPASKKYVQANYDATCGNGAGACSPGTGFAAETGSDTAPDKSTAPSAPTIDARAGWKRVALSLTQPADPDLSQTCVYVNDSASYPELLTDTASYPKVSGCLQINMASTPTAQLIPDSGGIFTSAELAAAASTSFWHDSLTEASPPVPSLADIGTYSYRAISFDLCGNGSSVSAAQATTILCGEDPATGEKPPAVTGASASCCSGPVALNWTQVPSDTSMPSSPANPYDLAGYRIFRSTSVDFTASSMVSGVAPFWGTSFSDTTAAEGGTYYYRIVSTDCPYERTNPPEAAIRGHMVSGYLNSVLVGPVRPGRIDRDEKCVGSSGSCTKDDHRQVLTGVDMNNSSGTGDNSSTVDTGFTHHKVTMFAHNTSSGTMTVTGVTVNWVNSAANLVDVRIGGGRSGMSAITTDIAPALSTTVSGNPPYTRGVSNVALTPVTIPAGARYVPIRFRFKDASDNEVDMRDDQLLVTLKVTNDATGTASCVSYMTVSRNPEAVYVPFGPSVTATQQNKPSSPTFGYAVPGATGLNVVASGVNGPITVDSGYAVAVTANIAGNTTDETTGGKIPVISATLYYKSTAKTTTIAPDSGYTAMAMTNAGGNIWSATIPSRDGYRVWYYIVAVDADGNWDRDPEIGNGSYVYDQKDFSICEVTPSVPATLSAVQSGSDAILTWSPVTTYTNGNTVDATDSIKYRIYRGGIQIGTDQAGTTYTDAGLAAGVYSYTVKALNACAAPGPKVSALSSTAATCVGISSQATLSVSPSTIYRGGSYTVNIVDCLAMRSDAPYTYGSTIESINSTVNFTGHTNTSSSTGYQYNPVIPETGVATGAFQKTITTTSDVTDTATKLYVGATDTVSVYYPFASPATRTVNVIVDPCTNTPKKPTGLTGSVNGNNMTLSWAAVTQNTDNSAIADLAGYKVYERVCAKNKPNCTGSDIVADWFQRTSVGPGTTSVTVSDDQGVLSQRIYYFKVSAYDSCGAPKESELSDPWNE